MNTTIFSLSLLLATVPLTAAAPLSWADPETLYSSAGSSGTHPRLAVDAFQSKATVAWLANGDGSTVYSADYNSGSWNSPEVISFSMEPQSSLRLRNNAQGTQVAVWNVQSGENVFLTSSVNEGSGWSSPSTVQDLGTIDVATTLHLTTADEGAFLLSWQDLDDSFYGIAYLLGNFTSPFSINANELSILQSALSRGQAIFVTSDGLFHATITPSNTLEYRTSFPRTIIPASLFLDVIEDFSRSVFIFQDEKTKFLISAIVDDKTPVYTTISIPHEEIESACVSLSPIDKLPAAVWQLRSGKIRAARFDGHRWGNHITLSDHGSEPVIEYNPKTNQPVVVWADSTAGGTSNTIKAAEFIRTAWTTPVSISAGGNAVSEPQIKINKLGEAFVTWRRIPTSGADSLIEATYATP